MSHNYCIASILDLKDKNITFPQDNYIREEIIKGVRSKVISATLSFQPPHCYSCHHLFDANIIKHGFKSTRIKMMKLSGIDTYLDLKKQRYLCRHCHSTFTLETPLIEKNCSISNPLKQAIFLEASHKKSETDIARELNVSHSTVNRIIHSSYEEQPLDYNYLPHVLCFDEFKSTKSAEGAMSFVYCDGETGRLIDIVEDRRLSTLKSYFSRFSKEARYRVTHIVMDMYTPYLSLVKELFPKSKIVLDKFHVIQLLTRALNKTRIRFMNANKEFYNKFKHYWRLLLMTKENLNSLDFFYSPCFKKMISQYEIVEFLLSLDEELKATYDFYQDVLFSIKHRKFNFFNQTIENPPTNLSPEMKTSLKTLRKYNGYIGHMLECHYTNGVLEGINNKIKVIKRIAFGYRSFYHLKARILIVHKYTFLQKNKRNQETQGVT